MTLKKPLVYGPRWFEWLGEHLPLPEWCPDWLNHAIARWWWRRNDAMQERGQW